MSQYVFFNENSSNFTGASQGCLSLLCCLSAIDTNESRSYTASNSPILKFAANTAILGLINNNNEISYMSKVSKFVQWCNINYLQLNVNKTKEIVIVFRKKDTKINPLKINDQIIEQVSSTSWGYH